MGTLPCRRVNGARRRVERQSRREFLQRVATLGAAVVVPTAGAALLAPVDAASMKARTAVQWARLQRGLDPVTMAACRKVAERLAPRTLAVLAGPGWEAAMFKSVADELKKAGAYPDRRPPLDAPCAQAEADRLRNEAASGNPTSNAVGTGLAVAGAVVATIPVFGAINAAVLAMIAAVLLQIGQLLAQAPEGQATSKEQWAAARAADRTGDARERLRKMQEALVFKLERVGDCDAFGRKAS